MTLPDIREDESRLAQFSLLCSNLVWMLPGTFFAALAFSVAVAETLSLVFLIAWLLFVGIIQVTRLALLRYWAKTPTQTSNVRSRLRTSISLSFATGCSFGFLAYLAITPDKPLVSLIVVMIMTGMVALYTAVASFILPMYLLFILPLMLPPAIRMLTVGEPIFVWIGGLMLAFLVINIGASRNMRAFILRSIDLRFENTDLVDDLKHQHQRAEASLAREEKANLAKSRFLAAASHDLRQPLHSLRLFTATLEMQTRNSEHKTLVRQIDSSVKSLEELFNALLDISKLDAGTIHVERSDIYLDRMLMRLESEFTPLARKKNLHFSVQLDGQVVDTDAMLLERLIRNLLGNAFRYTKEGRVRVTSKLEDGRVWILINDTGIGIAQADQARVFEEFVQLGNTERDRSQGIGLGLSIVKRLADLLDVELQLTSAEGAGSTFRIGVPLGNAALCQLTDALPESSSDHIDSLFILVIDDEEEVCLAVEGLLETWGCIVMCANSGDAASKQLKEIGDTPDLVISDYRLREGETGGDVIHRLRKELAFDVPAIILSGDIAPERLQDIHALGFPLLHKPCEPEALRQLIAHETATLLARRNTPGTVISTPQQNLVVGVG